MVDAVREHALGLEPATVAEPSLHAIVLSDHVLTLYARVRLGHSRPHHQSPGLLSVQRWAHSLQPPQAGVRRRLSVRFPKLVQDGLTLIAQDWRVAHRGRPDGGISDGGIVMREEVAEAHDHAHVRDARRE